MKTEQEIKSELAETIVKLNCVKSSYHIGKELGKIIALEWVLEKRSLLQNDL